MYFLNFPPLWFVRGAPPTVTSVDVCVSLTYQASIGVDVLDSVDLDLSALAFGLSAALYQSSSSASVVSFVSTQVGIDLDDSSYSSLDLRASVTPVFQLVQSGETPVCVSSNYQVSVSVTASLGIDVTPTLTYQASISISAGVLIATNICVSADYRLSVAPFVLVDVQADTAFRDIGLSYGASISINPQVDVVNAGGLVYSRTKQTYIPVRVGNWHEDTI